MSVFSTQQWLDDGHTRHLLCTQLSRQEVVRLRRGYYMEADGPEPSVLHRRRVDAASSSLGASTYFCQTSAAVIHGLPLFAGRHGVAEVTRASGAHGSINDTLHARRVVVADDDTCEIDGLRVTTLGKTVADLIRWLPFAEAVMVADAGLHRGLTRGELCDRTTTGRGCRMAARVLEFADGRSESPGESLSRVRISHADLPVPELQTVLRDARGRFLGRVDFFWDESGVVGEFDGAIKYDELVPDGQTSADVIRAEQKREQGLRDAGFEVVRWGWDDLWTSDMTDRLRRVIASRSDTHSTNI